MSFRLTEHAATDIEHSPDPATLMTEIAEEFMALPPPDAPRLAGGAGDEGAQYLLVLPCGYRVVYMYPLVLGGGHEFLILRVRPGSKAHLPPRDFAPPTTDEKVYDIPAIRAKSTLRNVVISDEVDQPVPVEKTTRFFPFGKKKRS